MKTNKEKERKSSAFVLFVGLMMAVFGIGLLLLGGQGSTPPANDDGFNFCNDMDSKPIFNYTLKFSGNTIYYFNGTDSDDRLYLYTVFINGSYSIKDATTGYTKYSMAWQTLYDFHLEDAKEKELVSSQGYCWLKRMIWWIEAWG